MIDGHLHLKLSLCKFLSKIKGLFDLRALDLFLTPIQACVCFIFYLLSIFFGLIKNPKQQHGESNRKKPYAPARSPYFQGTDLL